MRNEILIIGLGANLQKPIEQFRKALLELRQSDDWFIEAVAGLYESDAQLPEKAPESWNSKYLNTAVALRLKKDLTAADLIQKLHSVEKKLGRVRPADQSDRWAPRTLDMDVLFWQDHFLNKAELTVPHPRLLDRPFALLPLIDLIEKLKLNTGLQNSWNQFLENKKTVWPKWALPWVEEKPFSTALSRQQIWPEMMAILNLTTDSFSDGGKLLKGDSATSAKVAGSVVVGQLDEDKLYAHAERQLKAGALYLDLGAESTRPHATPVSIENEIQILEKAFNVLSGLKKEYSFKISIDSRNARTIEFLAKNFSIDLVNDVSGFADEKMPSLVKELGCQAVAMHSLTVPADPKITWKDDQAPVDHFLNWALAKKKSLQKYSFDSDQLIFDVGVGFGKTRHQSLDLLLNLNKIREFLSEKMLLGISRKSFLTAFTERPSAERDLETSLITSKIEPASFDILRVHDVETQKLALVFESIGVMKR